MGRTSGKKYDLSTLRLIAVAGEPLNPEAMRWAHTHLLDGGKRGFVADNWWQTELGGPTIATPIAKASIPGAAGVALPGVEAAVVNERGEEVPKGKGGLLALRRPFPHMMRTIWNNHARYEQYWNEIPGCYTAGDVASWDDKGYISVLGRSDDVLNVAGHRIGTADVESALITHRRGRIGCDRHSRRAERRGDQGVCGAAGWQQTRRHAEAVDYQPCAPRVGSDCHAE